MKLTEAQLKRIIEEEVQIAIDEGLLDFARGAAGVASAVGGKIGSAVKGAAGKVGGAIKGAAGAAADAVGRGFDAAKSAAEEAGTDITHAAGKAVYSGKVKDLEQSLPQLINSINTGRGTTHNVRPELEQEYTDLLEKLLGILKKGQSEIQEILMTRKRTMAPAASTSRRLPPPPPKRPGINAPPPPAAAPKRGFILPTSKE